MNPGPVWIDVANSPQVLFFKPVRNELLGRGIDVVVTARDFSQTVALCRTLGIPAEVIGQHGGRSLGGKAVELTSRVAALRRFCRYSRPSVAVGHASYGLTVAGRSLGIPVLTAMDYEHQPANHVAFRCADLVAVPELFPLDLLRRQGARPYKTWRYSGLKEEVALAGFTPNRGYISDEGIDDSKVVVVVRPPADMALYHRFGNPLFQRILERLRGDEGLSTVLLPRTAGQAVELASSGFGNLVWHGEALDGRQLVSGADVVISAGGSMNREAAVLGTPAYSAYAGRPAALDRALAADGRLTFLESEPDIGKMRIVKKPQSSAAPVGKRLLHDFVDKVLWLREGGRRR